MILVDSSVWIDALRGTATRQTDLLHSLAADNQALGVPDLCLYEVLQGVKPASAMGATHDQLMEFPTLAVGGEYIAVTAARNSQFLRSKGYQVGTVDCLLATYCIVNGLRFLTADKDFDAFAAHLGLDLVR